MAISVTSSSANPTVGLLSRNENHQLLRVNSKDLGVWDIVMVNYWLMKSEPDVYPWEQLVADGSTHWDGVRNYQARNMMRDDMEVGDLVLFYHSNCKPPHVAGVAEVSKQGYPDFTSWDTTSHYFDEKSSPDNPRWFMVDIEPVSAMAEAVSLRDMKENITLEGMPLLRKGQRLSVQPVPPEHFHIVCEMGGLTPATM